MKRKTIILLLLALVTAVASPEASCRAHKVSKGNTNAIWAWSSHMNKIDLDMLADRDIGNIILNEKAFEVHGKDSVMAFVKAAKKRGITVHIWIQCCYRNGKWAYPMDDEHNCYDQEFYEEVVERACKYVGWGVKGIHLDYIRFGGTAYKHNPSDEITATGCITEFCRQLNVGIKKKNPRVVISAALMPEPDSEYYYGQNAHDMGQYIDILMPMIYRHSPGYRHNGENWSREVAEYFVKKGSPAAVWAGTTTYTTKENGGEDDVVPLDAATIAEECRDFIGTGVKGIALFRFDLGEIPDLHGILDQKTVRP